MSHKILINQLVVDALEVNAPIDEYVTNKLRHMGIVGKDYDKCMVELRRLMDS